MYFVPYENECHAANKPYKSLCCKLKKLLLKKNTLQVYIFSGSELCKYFHRIIVILLEDICHRTVLNPRKHDYSKKILLQVK